jgi:hypothetical protein
VTEDTKQISFRVTQEEYNVFERIAGLLAEKGKIRNGGVGTLAKALLFMKINEFLEIERVQKAIDERGEALKARNVPQQGLGYF